MKRYPFPQHRFKISLCYVAKEVERRGDAKCIPLWNGAGTVKVIIINADKQAADAALINAVKNHIEDSALLVRMLRLKALFRLP